MRYIARPHIAPHPSSPVGNLRSRRTRPFDRWALLLFRIARTSNIREHDQREPAVGVFALAGSRVMGVFVAVWLLLGSATGEAAQWLRTVGSPGDGLGAIAVTFDGGYVAVGSVRSFGSGGSDAWVVRLDAAGNVVWQKAYGGAGTDAAVTALPARDGTITIVGGTSSTGAGSHDGWVFKLDAQGSVVWQKTFGGPGDDGFNAGDAASDGGLCVAGTTIPAGAESSRPWVLRLDASGSTLWQQTYEQPGYLEDVRATADGGCVVAGYVGGAVVLKLDATGSLAWQRIYGAPGQGSVEDIQLTKDGGFIAAGYTSAFGAGGYDAMVLRLDSRGDVIWEKAYGGPSYDTSCGIAVLPDNGFVVTGVTIQSGASEDGVVWRVDDNGNILWQHRYGGTGYDSVCSPRPTPDGGMVGVANFHASRYGTGETIVLKLDADGVVAGCADVHPSESVATPGNAQTSKAALTNRAADLVTASGSLIVRDGPNTTALRCFDPGPASRLTAIEYFHRDYGHYFVTALPPEITALDAGIFLGWSRTGQSFDVLALGAPSAANVCRFWTGQTFAPKSSHFYTPYAAECLYLKQQGVWLYEEDSFGLELPIGPAGHGSCRPATQPLYRAYNNGISGAPNHRYTTDPLLLDAMIAQGWVMEGEAATRVFACVPVPE